MTIGITNKGGRRLASYALTGILAMPPALWAQEPAAPAKAVAPMTQTLRVLVLAGRDGQNELETGRMSLLAVQVLDQNDLPVEGAEVVFRFPLTGPSATFASGQNSQTVRSDATGQARATGWTANSELGSFTVQVTATRGSEQGTAAVRMSNVPRALPVEQTRRKSWWRSKWALIAYGAAAAATIIVLNVGDDPITIHARPGTPSVGGPQ